VRRHRVEPIDTWPLFDPVVGQGNHVQLWPHRHGTDAMFAAALEVG
jgi:16S rRNA (cytosine967-C5)-methyltransferase